MIVLLSRTALFRTALSMIALFRTALPFWGQTSLLRIIILRNTYMYAPCSTKRVKSWGGGGGGCLSPPYDMTWHSPFLLDAPSDGPDEAECEQLVHEGVELGLWQRKRVFCVDNQGLIQRKQTSKRRGMGRGREGVRELEGRGNK